MLWMCTFIIMHDFILQYNITYAILRVYCHTNKYHINMQIRYATIVIHVFMRTIQLINDLDDYRILLFFVWIQNRQQKENMNFGLFIKIDLK